MAGQGEPRVRRVHWLNAGRPVRVIRVERSRPSGLRMVTVMCRLDLVLALVAMNTFVMSRDVVEFLAALRSTRAGGPTLPTIG